MLIQLLVGYTLHNNKKVFLCIYNLREKCFQKPIFPETNSIQFDSMRLTFNIDLLCLHKSMANAVRIKLEISCVL